MATKQDRGTKRTCQNSECGSRFYDLNHNPITCPICGAKYVIASSPIAVAAVAEDKPQRKPKKEEYVKPAVAEEEVEAEVALADVDTEEAAVAEEGDETFLEEEEEEGGDVATIIGPVAEGEEP